MSRRDNGLPSDEWQRLTDLAPPIADHVLEVFRDEGIAAYAAPRVGEKGTFLETPSTGGPLDEVFVGSEGFDRARDLLDDLLPQLADLRDQPPATSVGVGAGSGPATEDEPVEPPRSEDEIWASLVAAYSAPAADRHGLTLPASDEPPVDEPAPPPVDDTAPTTPRRAATGFDDIAAEIGAERERREQQDPPLAEEHEHYVPPTPPPIPQGDTVSRMAWVGVLGGPLWLILATLLGWGPGGLPGLIAVLAFVGGFVTLVTRLEHDRDDDGDDGAVV